MNQNELNHAVAQATQESVGAIASLGFSLLSLPPAHPLSIRPERRRYPLRLAREVRRPPRRRTKSSAKSAVRSVTKHPDGKSNKSLTPRLVRFDRGD